MTHLVQHNRGTIFVEDAQILQISEFPAMQYVMRLLAPKCAARASAGSFIHIQCDQFIPMRRPLSIMRAHPADGWIDILFKNVGAGLAALSSKAIGDKVSVLGPIGNGFTPIAGRESALLIGGGVGIPPIIFLAESLQGNSEMTPLVIMGSEIPFPFETKPSELVTPWLDQAVNQTMPFLENLDIVARLASLQGYAGCYQGYVTDLARRWLDELGQTDRNDVAIFSCGPTPMLRAVADLAREFDLPCQLSLEEYMACAVGGCAGCTVAVRTNEGEAMKRVCVDGPVFNAEAVF